ncbi:hypothetical protein [Fredinandcohnia onubensis]|uniref:hypothetical protein n=1 Tax=Fredinandcohnia onubensis TaxID=1571209 RepID=UPI000C0BEEEC|nr:hypothetical protein [Fredinandcohnia onubensis]
MREVLKSTKYCDLLAQGIAQDGEDLSAVERIYVKNLQREEIRFAWYKEKNGTKHFQLRPLDLTEKELLELLNDGIKNEVFSPEFKENLKKLL